MPNSDKQPVLSDRRINQKYVPKAIQPHKPQDSHPNQPPSHISSIDATAMLHDSPLSATTTSSVHVQPPIEPLIPSVAFPVVIPPPATGILSTSHSTMVFSPSKEIGFPSQPVQVSSDVDEKIVCLDSDLNLHNALMKITDNPLFLSMKAQDDVGVGRHSQTTSNDHLSLIASRDAHLLSPEEFFLTPIYAKCASIKRQPFWDFL